MHGHVRFRFADTYCRYLCVTGRAGVSGDFADGMVWTLGGSIHNRHQGVSAIRATMRYRRRSGRGFDGFGRSSFGSFRQRNETFSAFISVSSAGRQQGRCADGAYHD
jgi:hypothetical protein